MNKRGQETASGTSVSGIIVFAILISALIVIFMWRSAIPAVILGVIAVSAIIIKLCGGFNKKSISIIVVFAILSLAAYSIYYNYSKQAQIEKAKAGALQIAPKALGFFGSIGDWLSTKLFGVKMKEGINQIIGYRSFWEGWGNFWVNFLIGLIAGVLLFLGNYLVSWFVKPIFKDWGSVFTAHKIIRESAAGSVGSVWPIWLDFLGGSPDRVLIIAFVYATLMQISFVNRAIEIITFYHSTPIWLRPMMLAIIIGYFPAIIESLIHYYEHYKYEKEVLKAKVGIKSIKEAGEI
jgi:hypothetical protein